jgi:hypothetical protein
MQQYGVSFDLTPNLIEWNLHTRNYWLGTTPITPPATKPTMTMAQILKASVDFALQYYNYPTISSQKTYIASGTWSNIVNVAINKDEELESQYTVLAGLNGLSGLAEVYDPLAPCHDAYGNLVTCGSPNDVGWGTKWGPTILTLLGSILSLIGTTWSASQLRNQAASTYYQTTGTTLGVGNTRDAELLAQQIQRLTGMSYDRAYEHARILLGLPPEEKSDLTKYLLPLGIGIGAYLLISRRS